MNGVTPPFGQPPQLWQEHRTPDGRSYFYNTVTKVTQWTKPEELMDPAEVRSPVLVLEARWWAGANARFDRGRSRTSHGRSTRPRAAANIGTIPRRSRAPGRCQTSIRGFSE